ncbi:unnamed protein product [marine sediment metagenome]|uniref:Uncharacterized protein n=1 Tax=marine sediment metagenome TaxID=412755 RepID=X1B2M2_9ZZZZ
MPDIELLAKPHIRLIGTNLDIATGLMGTYNDIVDHSKLLPAISTTTIQGATKKESFLDISNMLTFQDSVRIIITGKAGNKYNYRRKEGELTDLWFEGNQTFNTQSGPNTGINTWGETYFTLNGKDPIRTRKYLYNYRDWDDYHEVSVSESNPSQPSWEGGKHTYDNANELGFLLRNNQTGSKVFTLKARTYFQGNYSRIALVIFCIITEVRSPFFESNELDSKK